MVDNPNWSHFEYVIKFPDGAFFVDRIARGEGVTVVRGTKREALTFTETGAYRKIDSLPALKGCTVEHK